MSIRNVLCSCALILPLLASGCGSSKQTDTVSSAGGAVIHKPPTYKGQDKELITRSNTIPVYSTPDKASRIMQRPPDNVVTESNGVVAHYYDSDNTGTAERLRLRYAEGHLIGKEIVPPDVNANGMASSAPVSYGRRPDVGLPAKTDPNAAFNANFNQQLNVRH